MYRARLIQAGVAEDTLAGIERTAAEAVERATDEAKSGAEPSPELLMKDVWADGSSSWRN
jgi:TPP-dependent pyruvate/acetoin dehydrogenase alpha subunit